LLFSAHMLLLFVGVCCLHTTDGQGRPGREVGSCWCYCCCYCCYSGCFCGCDWNSAASVFVNAIVIVIVVLFLLVVVFIVVVTGAAAVVVATVVGGEWEGGLIEIPTSPPPLHRSSRGPCPRLWATSPTVYHSPQFHSPTLGATRHSVCGPPIPPDWTAAPVSSP